eukprot:NODE_4_length_77007_cov_1.156642.p48 type:complete len:230 gc:universal NODE_4_length_77007_cov_1.156642:1566-877(-)
MSVSAGILGVFVLASIIYWTCRAKKVERGKKLEKDKINVASVKATEMKEEVQPSNIKGTASLSADNEIASQYGTVVVHKNATPIVEDTLLSTQNYIASNQAPADYSGEENHLGVVKEDILQSTFLDDDNEKVIQVAESPEEILEKQQFSSEEDFVRHEESPYISNEVKPGANISQIHTGDIESSQIDDVPTTRVSFLDEEQDESKQFTHLETAQEEESKVQESDSSEDD